MTVEQWLGENNTLGIDIWHQKYQYSNETFDEWLHRISNNNSIVEKHIIEKKFLPGGRILANRGLAGKGRKVTYSNCYVISPPEDNLESIFECASKLARTYSYGGGCGVDISKLSPKGAKIHNAAKETSGAVSFMDLYSTVTGLIGQNGRRGALMISLSCDHPDLEEFIGIKTDLNRVTKANISIRITKPFMDAVKRDKDFKLSFCREETGECITKTINARQLFRKIAETNWDYAEPGTLFWDRICGWSLLSNDPNFEFAGTNPCVTGDTLIFTGDGRYMVPIEQLYREYISDPNNFNVPALTWDNDLMRTKFDKINWVQYSGVKPVYTVTLDDGSTIKATLDHKFMLSDGTKKPLSELSAGDCLMPFRCRCYEEYSGHPNTYVGLNNGKNKNYYHLQSEYYFGTDINLFGFHANNLVVHHKDGNHSNNLPLNLSVMLASEHSSYHLQGDNNPMRKWFNETSEERRMEYRKNMSIRNTGSGNPNYGKVASADKLIKLSNATRRFMKDPKVKERHKSGNMRHRASMIKSVFQLLEDNNLEFNEYNYNQYKLQISKVCPSWSNIMKTGSFFGCSSIDEFVNYLFTEFNHKIVSIEYFGDEPVYDMNMVHNHNFAVVTKSQLSDSVEEFTGNIQDIKKLTGIIIGNCAEEPLPAGGSCLLSSINLSEFVRNPFMQDAYFDIEDFRSCVNIGIKYLNEVLDEGLPLHPLKEQQDSVKNWRQVGLGIMGLADCLIKLGLTYGTEDSVELCNMISKHMIQQALITSSNLAEESGTYPKYFKDAIFESPFFINAIKDMNDTDIEHIERYGLRNSQLLTIAPTGTLSTMLGISGGIEPIYANYYTRKTESLYGEDRYYKVYTPIVQQYLTKHHCETDDDLPSYFVTAMDLNYKNRINMQAAWQEYIDASISSTINIPNNFTVDDVENLYMYAYNSRLKGVTIFRDGCARLGILSTDNSSKNSDTDNTSEFDTAELKRGEVIQVDNNLIGRKRKLITGCGSLHCTAFFDRKTKELREVYLSKGSTGGCNNFMVGLSRMISISARSGVSIEKIVDQLNSTGSCPSYAIRNATKQDTSKGSCCPMAVGNALMDMYQSLLSETISDTSNSDSTVDKTTSSAKCPQCGEPLIFEEGCNICKNCGWSKCS